MINDKEFNYSSVSVDDFADAVAEVLHRKSYKEIVTFKEIVAYAIEEKRKNPTIVSFVISVKKNYEPQNENDKFIIIQGFLDSKNKPISIDGKDSESRILHTRTSDKKFVEVLDGAGTKIIKL